MKFLIPALVLLVILPGLSAAEQKPLVREDFAFGMDLTINGRNAIYSLLMPAQVYQDCVRSDLGDLRVFNASNPVPHLLRPQLEKENMRPAQAVPFFPLSGNLEESGSPPGLRISIGHNGTIISLRPSRVGISRKTVTAYLIDASGLEQQADWLELFWSGQEQNFSTSVRVESSQDLNSWKTVVHSTALAELDFGGQRLVRRRIRVRIKGQYLRISWPSGKDGVTLSAIRAGYDRKEQARSRTVISLKGTRDPKPAPGRISYLYDSHGFFPVDQLHIRLPQKNSLARTTIFSKANEQAPWRRRASLLAYQLMLDGTSLASEIQNINSTRDRFWRLEMEDTGGSEPPVLELGWLPGELVFMAQGDEPFTLAYGRAGLARARYEVDRLLAALDPLREKKLVGEARVGKQILLGGEDMLVPAVEIPWKRWLLWVGLILGVLVVGIMALQLFREMQREKE